MPTLLQHTTPNLDPDDALLAGLVHNIGYLPMAKCVETYPEIENDPNMLIEIMGKVHTQVSEMILKSWAFPQHIIDASVHYVEQFRRGTAEVDLTDIVIIARPQYIPWNRSSLYSS